MTAARRRAGDLTFGDATAPTAAQPVPPPPTPAEPAPHNAVASVSPDLASWLGRSDETDKQSGGNGGVSIPLSRLVAAAPLDPETDLVNKGVSIPRYLDQALKTTAFLSGRPIQHLVADALRAHLPQELVAEARRAAGT